MVPVPPLSLIPLQDTPAIPDGVTFAWVAWTLFTGGAVGYLVRTITCPTHPGFGLVIPVSGYRLQLGFFGALLAGVAGAAVMVFIDLTLLRGVLSGLGAGTESALEVYLRLIGLGVIAGYGTPVVLARLAAAPDPPPGPGTGRAPAPPRRESAPAPRGFEREEAPSFGPFEEDGDRHLLSTPLDSLEAEVLLMDPESADGYYNRARMKELHRRASRAQGQAEVFAASSVYDDLRAMVHLDRTMAGVVASSAEFADLRGDDDFHTALAPPASGA